jgi:hypothetical protein
MVLLRPFLTAMIVLMACTFIWKVPPTPRRCKVQICVDTGRYGKQNDCGTFIALSFHQSHQNGTVKLPKDAIIPQTEIPLPRMLSDGDTFPLKTYLMKSYSRRNLSR